MKCTDFFHKTVTTNNAKYGLGVGPFACIHCLDTSDYHVEPSVLCNSSSVPRMIF